MPRSLKEWFGDTDDTAVPPRVRLRVFEKFGRRCADCRRSLRSGDQWTCDHVIALINGGQNRENNLRPLCEWCNQKKNQADVTEKSIVYAKRLSDVGIKPKKFRPLIGTKASGWKHKMSGQWVRR